MAARNKTPKTNRQNNKAATKNGSASTSKSSATRATGKKPTGMAKTAPTTAKKRSIVAELRAEVADIRSKIARMTTKAAEITTKILNITADHEDEDIELNSSSNAPADDVNIPAVDVNEPTEARNENAAPTKPKKKPKAAKTTRKVAKATTVKENAILKREEIPDKTLSNELKQYLSWSKWHLALIPRYREDISNIQGRNFFACKNLPAYAPKNVFDNATNLPAIYEFAVTAPGVKVGKKHVVYFTMSNYPTRSTWLWQMVGNKHIRKELDLCLKADCSVWARRAVAKGRSKDVSKKSIVNSTKIIKARFDYAWRKYAWRKVDNKMCHRGLFAKNVLISHDDL